VKSGQKGYFGQTSAAAGHRERLVGYQRAGQPDGRSTYHSVNSRHRPAESNRITKQLS
jgi:hypothetical protein